MIDGEIGLRSTVSTFQEDVGFWRTKERTVEVPCEAWTVNGRFLIDFVDATESLRAPDSEATLLSERWIPGVAGRNLQALLSGEPGDFEDGRIALYVCQVCADLDCGTFSTEVVIGETTVEWRNLGWQIDYEPGVSGWDPPLTFRFDRIQYESVLGEALSRWEG